MSGCPDSWGCLSLSPHTAAVPHPDLGPWIQSPLQSGMSLQQSWLLQLLLLPLVVVVEADVCSLQAAPARASAASIYRSWSEILRRTGPGGTIKMHWGKLSNQCCLLCIFFCEFVLIDWSTKQVLHSKKMDKDYSRVLSSLKLSLSGFWISPGLSGWSGARARGLDSTAVAMHSTKFYWYYIQTEAETFILFRNWFLDNAPNTLSKRFWFWRIIIVFVVPAKAPQLRHI